MEGAPGDPGYVRGSALGLPADGPGAVAPIWRRLLTLIVDWALSVGIAMLLFNYHELAVLGTFVVLNLLCISLFGATPGQFLLRVRVLPVRGRSPMPLRALVRTVLILLIIPSWCGTVMRSPSRTWSPALPWCRSEASPLILASHAPRRTAGRERRGSRAAFKPGARQEDGPDPLLRNRAGPSAAGCQRPRMALRL